MSSPDDRAASRLELEGVVARVQARLDDGRLVRESLPGAGRLHVERALPFLCVYRRPAEQRDPGTETFVTGEPAYLVAPEERIAGHTTKLVQAVMQSMLHRFGGFLFLEVRTAPATRGSEEIAKQPTARVIVQTPGAPEETLGTLERELEHLALDERPPRTLRLHHDRPEDPLVAVASSSGAFYVVLELDPVHYDPATREPYPLLLRNVRDELAPALRRTLYDFSCAHTNHRPSSPVALGRREVLHSDWQVDRELDSIAAQTHLLLYVTPVNTHAAREAFIGGPKDREPEFYYRHVTIDPDLLTRRLYEIPLDEVEDPTLLHLYREQREAIAARLRMLVDRNTPKFVYTSLQLYGGVDDKLLRLAQGLTAAIHPKQKHRVDRGRPLSDQDLAAEARREIEHYRSIHPEFRGDVEIRDDVAGILVDEGRLLLEKGLEFTSGRLSAILQHEIGTHVVTHFNGSRQPLRQLASGLAGYDELQEGLAVLSEYLVGQLSPSRLRLLAGRVVAVDQLLGGASFLDIYHSLTSSYGFRRRTAFNIAMRVCRSGGLTKDAVYLRGLVWLLGYLEAGHAIEPMFLGKPGIRQLPAIEELTERQVLSPPAVTPRYLEGAQASKRLKFVRKGVSVLELVERR